MTIPPVILWFRQDLRVSDNPALRAAVESGARVIPLYILDDENAGKWKMGGASRWWLAESLSELNKSLGGALVCKKGRAQDVLDVVIAETGARAVFWNRCYEPWRIKRDSAIKTALKARGADVRTFNAALLFEPWEGVKDDGNPYKVFTPFYKSCLGKGGEHAPVPDAPLNSGVLTMGGLSSDDLGLMPSNPPWHRKMGAYWRIGEAGAQAALSDFLDGALLRYKTGRDFPAEPFTSHLSPHLHFGEISPRQILVQAKNAAIAFGGEGLNETLAEPFLRQLFWRDFAHSMLYHFPDMPEKPLQEKFAAFPWMDNVEYLERWQKGETGIHIVDAGMKELWETGYMHNRVRMIVGSFLVKNLLIHWHAGQDWFWDCLVDADLANNSFGWQWIAGCGADAAPYFRIFNPVTQQEKFDSDGKYIKRWLGDLSKRPAPVVDLKASRARALEALQQTKNV